MYCGLCLRLLPHSCITPLYNFFIKNIVQDFLMYNEFDTKFENVSKLFQNLDLIGNARIYSVMYDLAPAHTGRRGRPANHGKRLSVETRYYEQKTFWPFCNYMVRSCKGIEMLVNLINISYCAMKILPYQKNNWTSIFRQISPSFNHYSSHQILIQAQILAHCSHKLKNAVQSSQIVLHFLNTGGFLIFCYNLM